MKTSIYFILLTFCLSAFSNMIMAQNSENESYTYFAYCTAVKKVSYNKATMYISNCFKVENPYSVDKDAMKKKIMDDFSLFIKKIIGQPEFSSYQISCFQFESDYDEKKAKDFRQYQIDGLRKDGWTIYQITYLLLFK